MGGSYSSTISEAQGSSQPLGFACWIMVVVVVFSGCICHVLFLNSGLKNCFTREFLFVPGVASSDFSAGDDAGNPGVVSKPRVSMVLTEYDIKISVS